MKSSAFTYWQDGDTWLGYLDELIVRGLNPQWITRIGRQFLQGASDDLRLGIELLLEGVHVLDATGDSLQSPDVLLAGIR